MRFSNLIMLSNLVFFPIYRVYSNVPDKPTTPEKNTKRKSWNKMAGSLLTKVKTFKQNSQNQPQQSQQQQQTQQQQQRPVYGSIDVEQARLKREKEFELLLGQQEQHQPQQQPQQQHSSKQPTYSQVDVERAQFLREQRTRQQQQQQTISHNQTSNSNPLNQNFPCSNQSLTKFNWYHGKISQVKSFFFVF